jgi:hypothetical protein
VTRSAAESFLISHVSVGSFVDLLAAAFASTMLIAYGGSRKDDKRQLLLFSCH